MDVSWTFFILVFLQCAVYCHTASIGFVAGGDAQRGKPRANLWETIPNVLKKVQPRRKIDQKSIDDTKPSTKYILDENKVLREIKVDHLFIESDIYLGPEAQKNAIIFEAWLWDDGIVPYEIDPNFDSDAIAKINEAIAEYHTHTCLRFVRRTTETDYLYIFPGSGCWSSIGKDGGRQALSLGYGCTFHKTTPMHEFMHAVGFAHEQSRTDRDTYVYIVLENIISGMEHNFDRYEEDYIQDLGSSYDYFSIMHYHDTAFTVNGESTIIPLQSGIRPEDLGSSLDFTETDIYKLNALYNCDGGGGDDGDDGDDGDGGCGAAYLLSNGDSLQITSPNHPSNYGDNVDCTWTVTNADGGNVQLVFNSFQTEAGYDYVQYGSGSTPDADAQRHDGNEIPGSLTSSGDSVWLTFHSDGSQSFSGFQLTANGIDSDGGDQIRWRDDYQCGPNYPLPDGSPAECDPNGIYPCCSPYDWCGNTPDHCECPGCIDFRDDDDGGNEECGGNHIVSAGNSIEITSPNHPENYGDNVDCTWTVTNADGGNVQLVFNSFQTETGYDYVQYGSGSTPDAAAPRHDGSEIPGSLTSSGDSVWLTFHSDGSQSFSGFRLIASGVDDNDDDDGDNSECGVNYLVSTGESFEITSPNYPENYGDNVDCTWTVTNADGGNVQLVFNSFQTETGYDYVQYGSGSTPDADAPRHDGSDIPGSLTSSGDSVWLTFHSDGSQSFSGFQVMASGVGGDDDDDDDNSECGGNHIVSAGNSIEITSPNYPENYGDNVDCTWTVTNADGGNVQLVFNSFQTETGYDYVQYGSGSTPDADAPRHDGSDIPGSLTSSGDSVWLTFHSDGSQSFSGFQLIASGVDDNDDDDDDDNDECGVNYLVSTGESFEISSPNYPENYGDNVDCTWAVTNADGGNVQLVFNSFQTETGYDYVQYGSGSTPDADAPRHDGSEIPGSLTSSGDSVWIAFHSDGSQSFSGFQLTASGVGDDGDDDDDDDDNGVKMSKGLFLIISSTVSKEELMSGSVASSVVRYPSLSTFYF
ncbi:bone morphogenetic protein 1-like [Ptychodera flava]|uniref:bone morphogenetic protein 1-like n=1 Tax=Ptychodera flava TaxID=63121 RepID=UPI00396A5A8D